MGLAEIIDFKQHKDLLNKINTNREIQRDFELSFDDETINVTQSVNEFLRVVDSKIDNSDYFSNAIIFLYTTLASEDGFISNSIDIKNSLLLRIKILDYLSFTSKKLLIQNPSYQRYLDFVDFKQEAKDLRDKLSKLAGIRLVG